jgi:hypothetical protein
VVLSQKEPRFNPKLDSTQGQLLQGQQILWEGKKAYVVRKEMTRSTKIMFDKRVIRFRRTHDLEADNGPTQICSRQPYSFFSLFLRIILQTDIACN